MEKVKATVGSNQLCIQVGEREITVPTSTAWGAKVLKIGNDSLHFNRPALEKVFRDLTGDVWPMKTLNSLADLEGLLTSGIRKKKIEALLQESRWSDAHYQQGVGLSKCFATNEQSRPEYKLLTNRIFDEYLDKKAIGDDRFKQVTKKLRHAVHLETGVTAREKDKAQEAISPLKELKESVDTLLKGKKKHLAHEKYEEVRLNGQNIYNQNSGSTIEQHIAHAVSRILTPLRKAVARAAIGKRVIPRLAATQGKLRSGLWSFNERMKRKKWEKELAEVNFPTHKVPGTPLSKWLNTHKRPENKKHEWLQARSEGLNVTDEGAKWLLAWFKRDNQLPTDHWQREFHEQSECFVLQKKTGIPLERWLKNKSGRAVATDKYDWLWLLANSKGLHVTKTELPWLIKWLHLDATPTDDRLDENTDNVCGEVLTASKNKNLPSWEGVEWYKKQTDDLKRTLATEQDGIVLEVPTSERISEDTQLTYDVINLLYPNRREFVPVYRSSGLICRPYSHYAHRWKDLDPGLREKLSNQIPMYVWQAGAIASELGLRTPELGEMNVEIVPPKEFLGMRFDFKVNGQPLKDQSYLALVTHAAKQKVTNITSWEMVRKCVLTREPEKKLKNTNSRFRPPVRATAKFVSEKRFEKGDPLKSTWWLSYSNYAFALPPGSVVKEAIPRKDGLVKKVVKGVTPKNWHLCYDLETYFPSQLATLSLPLANYREKKDKWGTVFTSSSSMRALKSWANRSDSAVHARLNDRDLERLQFEVAPRTASAPWQLARLRTTGLSEKNAKDGTMRELSNQWSARIPSAAVSLWGFMKSHQLLPKSKRENVAKMMFPRVTVDRLEALEKRLKATQELFSKKKTTKVSLWDVYFAHWPELALVFPKLEIQFNQVNPYRVSLRSLEDAKKHFNHPPKELQDLIAKEAPLFRFRQ